MKKIIGLLLISILMLAGCSTKSVQAEVNVPYNYNDKVECTLTDYYYGDYRVDEEMDLNFDKYLAVDLSFTNTTNQTLSITTLNNFSLADNSSTRRHVLIDENKKDFKDDLPAGETWNITLVFPVNESDSYTLYYSKSAKEKNEDIVSWELSANNLATKDVDLTTEHSFNPDIEFNPKQKLKTAIGGES